MSIPQYGRTVENGVVTIRIPETWVLFNERGQAVGWRRADTHLNEEIYTPEDAHRLFAKGRQLQHERLIGYNVRGYSWDEGIRIASEAMGHAS